MTSRHIWGALLSSAVLVPTVAAVLASTSWADAAQRTPRQAPTQTPCYRSASVQALAKAAHRGPASISLTKSVGSNGMPQCTFAPRGHDRKPSVTVNVDNGPQAFFRLSRTVEEATQIFGPPPPGWHAPIGLRGLGPEASWFPELGSLMAVSRDRLVLVTVHVDWPRSTRNHRIALARRMILPFVQRRADGS